MGEAGNKYETGSAKILSFCVTRWTVRVPFLYNLLKNCFVPIILFCTVMSNNKQRSSLDQDKIREIVRLVKYL